MLDADGRRAFRFDLSQLTEVVAKPVDAATVESGPECRFAHRDAAHSGHAFVVVRHAGDHVNVRVDVVHASFPVPFDSVVLSQRPEPGQVRSPGRFHCSS